MKKVNVKAFNQEYKSFILVETMEELETYIKEVLNNCFMASIPTYKPNLRKAIKEGAKLVFNPYNNVSYFTLPKDAVVTFL